MLDREAKNAYHREYMKTWRLTHPHIPKNDKRICPDCESREVEYRKMYCSECAEVRDQLNRDLAYHKWIKGTGKDYHKNYWRRKRCSIDQ